MSVWDRFFRRGRRAGDDGDEAPPEWASLVARARALPDEMAPERDLWTGIANRIRERAPEPDPSAWSSWSSWSEWSLAALFPRPLAAAAVGLALVVTTAFGVSFYMGGADPGGAPGAVSGEAGLVASRAEDPSVIAARLRERDGVAEVHRDIRAILDAHRDRLPPETIAVVEDNLLRIDQAIAEIHFALESNPDHHGLSFMLAEAYRSEAELLERLEWWLEETPETTS